MRLYILKLILLTLFFQFNVFPQTIFTFTNCGQDGRFGPSQSQCDTEYYNTTLDEQVTVIEGIQQWVVPSNGIYTIEVFGAKGGPGDYDNSGYYYPERGGKGARIKGDFNLNYSDTIFILVGQKGTNSGGGGGSVVSNNQNIPLIVAGGGGSPGCCLDILEDPFDPVHDGFVSNDTNGFGGECIYTPSGSAGGGFYTNGETCSGSTGGLAYIFNGTGGVCTGPYGSHGGFGMGGAGSHGWAGGGGGYSGGAGGGDELNEQAQGGGSYNIGSNQDNEPGFNEGHGYVIITYHHNCSDTTGDINDDTSVDILDILTLVDFIVNNAYGMYDSCMDINSDSNLNILDVMQVINIILYN